ncbi:hypothetical protein [Methylocystis sp. B8]|uniref:hypothetical protein n=1 Tax=Methylocystis sp. B8 TaxID=544938 RepID=UPI001FEF0C57|nr:hypothetical protein [Methylocystis sp. B8]
MPVILNWRDASTWMTGGDPGALLHPPPEDAAGMDRPAPRVNRSDVGDDDATLTERAVAA